MKKPKIRIYTSFSLEEGLNIIRSKKTRRRVEGFYYSTKRMRLRVFAEKGTKCISCGKQGHKFVVMRGLKEPKHARHLCLYAEDWTLMTADHIIPRSKGGTTTIENLQPMCCYCNSDKGNEYEDENRLC